VQVSACLHICNCIVYKPYANWLIILEPVNCSWQTLKFCVQALKFCVRIDNVFIADRLSLVEIGGMSGQSGTLVCRECRRTPEIDFLLCIYNITPSMRYCTRWRQSCNNRLSYMHIALNNITTPYLVAIYLICMTISPFPVSQSETMNSFR
jgi:hypothetical protein